MFRQLIIAVTLTAVNEMPSKLTAWYEVMWMKSYRPVKNTRRSINTKCGYAVYEAFKDHIKKECHIK